jgi:SAM-dependent methyltransferase
MVFDSNWELIFRNRPWGKYPSEEVIRFVARGFYSRPDRKDVRILDLGCGGGANTWFLAREGFDVVAIDGSPSAIEQAKILLGRDGLSAEFVRGDVENLPFSTGIFDAIIDSNCIQHNRWNGIRKIYADVHGLLKPGGRLLSIVLGDASSAMTSAVALERNTYTNFDSRFMDRDLLAHFFTREEIAVCMAPFSSYSVDLITRTADSGKETIANFIISAER